MNSDTFARVGFDYPNGHVFLTAQLSLASTTETAFSLANGNPAVVSVPSQSAIVGSSTPLDPNANPSVLTGNYGRPGAGYRGAAPYFSSSSFDGKAFRVRAAGKITVAAGATAAQTESFSLYVGNSATLGSDSKLATLTSGAGTVASSVTTNGNFIIEATLLWDSVSQKVQGEIWGNILGTYIPRSTAITPASVPLYTGLQFVLSTQFSVAAPTSSTITLVEFAVEPA